MADNHELFDCSICLDLLKDPVTTACGHSYCMVCINDCWNQDDQKGVYRCPQCRQTFTTRPVLSRNTLLAKLVEKQKTGFQDTPPTQYAESGDVKCDICTERKRKAVKSCLTCLVSYCKSHLKPHYNVAPLKRHKLVNASKQLQEKICPHHGKLLEVYCRTDQQCICYMCMMDDHKGHDTISATEEWTEKQRQLGKTKHEMQQRAQERERDIQELRQVVESLTDSTWVAMDDFERQCQEHILSYIHSMERKRFEVKEQIRAQAGAAMRQADGLLKQLRQEVTELRVRDAELEQLSHTGDLIDFLQSFKSLCDPPGSMASHGRFQIVTKFISEQKGRVENMCKDELGKMFIGLENNMLTIKHPRISSKPEYREREGFLKYSCYLTVEVDPNTVCASLQLSNSNREISWAHEAQSHPDHPDRFTFYHQALCKVGLSEMCYWEVEWDGGIIDVAVSYRGIRRKGWGNDCCFGHNDQSWSLVCSPSSCSFWHNNNNKTKIPVPCSSRVGVYLDHRAGVLSFYSVSDTMTLLHRVQTKFTEPLYPGFCVDLGSTMKICQLPAAQ